MAIRLGNSLTATRVCYGVPCVVKEDGKSILYCANTGDGFFALDAATGEKTVECQFL